MNADQTIATRFKIANLEKDMIGRGVMGKVYRATDSQTGELVAIKALDPSVVIHNPETLKRFLREGQALRQLNHPNIVKVIASFEETGRHYLVMEYIPGGSLQDLLASNAGLASRRVTEIALALANALTCAHQLGIIHRDLKPANVLLAEDGTPRITDFGCAYIIDGSRLTQAGILVGTTYYLSPEAFLGEVVDARTDIWALGVMVFELLTGQRPFTASNFTATITAILTQPVPDLTRLAPGVPEPLTDLVNRMLEKDHRKRIASMRQVAIELGVILRGK
jgi:serine/threonine protein kinase